MSRKIVQLCTFSSGGAGKAAYRLHHGLCQSGKDSTLLTLSKVLDDATVRVIHGRETGLECGFDQEVQLACTRWHRLNHVDYPLRPQGLEMFSDADSGVRLSDIDEIKSADIVHLHWVAGLVDYEEMGHALRGKRIVWTLHDMNPFTGGCHYAGDCLKYRESCGACPQLGSTEFNDISHAILGKKSRGLKNLDITIVTPSRWLASCAMQSALFGNYRVVCIPNGVPTDIFKPYNRHDIRRALDISPSAKVILFGAEHLGNNRKGFSFLLEALRRYRVTGNQEIVLAIFGNLDPSVTIDSPYPIFKCGSIHNELDLAYVYSMADLLIIPSLEDNLPNTALEAMACGTPVVGFSIGGIPDMVEHKKTGYLARSGDTDELLAGIDWIFSNAESMNLASNCRRKIETTYSIPTQVMRFELFYR